MPRRKAPRTKAELAELPGFDEDGEQIRPLPGGTARAGRTDTGLAPKYHPVHTPATATKLMRLGATETELADILGVNRQSILRWKQDHPEFLEAMNTGKDEADRRIEEALYHRALGFQRRTQKPLMDKAGNVQVVDLVETVPPDTMACMFWLKNRQRDKWRDVNRTEVVHSWENMTADELRAEIQRAAGELNADDAKALGFRVEVKAEPAKGRSN